MKNYKIKKFGEKSMDSSTTKTEIPVELPQPWPPRWFLDYNYVEIETDEEDRDLWAEAELDDFE